MFIPKLVKDDYTEGTVYRPINLSPLLLKAGKLVDKHIRDGTLKKYPLHENQHAYQTDKSTETTLHNMITSINNATELNTRTLLMEHSLTFD